MVKQHQFFKYKGQVLIQKMVFRPPFKKGRSVQNEGCFLYVKEVGANILSAQDNLKLKGREAVLLKCNAYFMEFVRNEVERDVEVIAIHLYPDLLKKLYINELPKIINSHRKEVQTKHLVDDEVMARFIESLEFYFDHPSLVNDDLLELKIKELILLLLQTNNIGSVLELIEDLYSPQAASLREVVSLHVYSNLSTEELARLSGMSLSSFKRAFKKQFSDTPANYIISEKLKKAKHLLAVSDMPVGDIAYDVGFQDPLYFSRVFTKREGVPPSTFRSNHAS